MINPTHLEAYSFFGLHKGPSLLILGGIHGDEICGSIAIKSINKLLINKDINILSGSLTMIPVANPLAARLNTRNGERNLNRNFYPKKNPKDFEDYLNNVICPIISKHDIILDLHSFKTGIKPFALIKSIDEDHSTNIEIHGQNIKLYEKTLASWLGIETVVGNWTNTYEKGVMRRKKMQNVEKGHLNLDKRYGMGTTEYSRLNGAIAVTLECGQHQDPTSGDNAFNAILSVLGQLKMIEKKRCKSKISNIKFVKLYNVFDKNEFNDRFLLSWKNFDPIIKNTEIAIRANGEKIRAPSNCCILFPNKNALPGQEWFYLAENL